MITWKEEGPELFTFDLPSGWGTAELYRSSLHGKWVLRLGGFSRYLLGHNKTSVARLWAGILLVAHLEQMAFQIKQDFNEMFDAIGFPECKI
jgi:hypothetical protein